MKMRVYEQRLYAEIMIGRPTMKAFKAMLCAEGLIGNRSKEWPLSAISAHSFESCLVHRSSDSIRDE
jgi:hypothetical protein